MSSSNRQMYIGSPPTEVVKWLQYNCAFNHLVGIDNELPLVIRLKEVEKKQLENWNKPFKKATCAMHFECENSTL